MTIAELYQQAETSYPPTAIVLRTVCRRIGTASQIAEALHRGECGAKRVRAWQTDCAKISFSAWLSLLLVDNMQNRLPE